MAKTTPKPTPKVRQVVTLTIPSIAVGRVVHALCRAGGHKNETPANAKKVIIEFIRATVRNVEQSEAEQAALATITEPDTRTVVS